MGLSTTASETTERNHQLTRRYFAEVLTQGKLDVINELMRSDFVFRISTIPGGVRGIDAYKGFVTGLRTAFPDGVFSIDRLIAEESRAAARWNFRGTHKGPFLGVAPTGKVMTDQGIDIFHIAGGKITDIWVNEDAFGLLKQLGVIPSSGAG
jgi:steroid delta-isomerase-like uncharacterized protein